MHRARECFRSLPLALLSLLAAASANAAPVPSLYAAIVPGSDPQHAAQAAMREVLVRLVGNRDAGDDPALAGIVEDAKRYVQLERNTTRGATQVIFDGPPLLAAVTAAGRSVWDPDRPLLWVLLPALAGSATDDLRSQLNAAAQVRGVPIALVSADSAGSAAETGNAGAAALLAAAHRAGAGAALTAQGSASDPQSMQWTLVAPNAEGHWTGSAAIAIDGVTDALVRASHELESTPAGEFDCQIAGVNDLAAFTTVVDTVGSLPGVSDVRLRAVDADQLTLHFKARAGAGSITHALAAEHLHSLGASGDGILRYRYQSGS
jgi:hypothetical protein